MLIVASETVQNVFKKFKVLSPTFLYFHLREVININTTWCASFHIFLHYFVTEFFSIIYVEI